MTLDIHTDSPAMHSYVRMICSAAVLLLSCTSRRLPVAKAAVPAFSGKRVLFLGDSITQDGTYITFIEYYLGKTYPTQKFDLIGLGLASETASGLTETDHPFPRPWVHNRLGAALDTLKPDIVVACYGMNDGIYHPQSPERMEAFQAGIVSLIGRSNAVGAEVILLTPPPFDPMPMRAKVLPENAPDFSHLTPFDQYDSVLKDYGRWERTLPRAGVQVIDIHTPLADYAAKQRRAAPDFSCNADGIHPSQLGHLLIAKAVLSALGVPISVDETDLVKTVHEPLYGLIAQHRQIRSDGWLPYVGYTRDGVFKTDDIHSTEQRAAALQKQIDHIRHRMTS